MKDKVAKGHSKKASHSGAKRPFSYTSTNKSSSGRRMEEIAGKSSDYMPSTDDSKVAKKSRAEWSFDDNNALLLQAIANSTKQAGAKIRWKNVLASWISLPGVPDYAKDFVASQLKSRYEIIRNKKSSVTRYHLMRGTILLITIPLVDIGYSAHSGLPDHSNETTQEVDVLSDSQPSALCHQSSSLPSSQLSSHPFQSRPTVTLQDLRLIELKDAPARTEFTSAENSILTELIKKNGTKWKVISRSWELSCKKYIYSHNVASSDGLAKDKKVYKRSKDQLEDRYKTVKDGNRSKKES